MESRVEQDYYYGYYFDYSMILLRASISVLTLFGKSCNCILKFVLYPMISGIALPSFTKVQNNLFIKQLNRNTSFALQDIC